LRHPRPREDTVRRRIVLIITAALATLAMTAAPASAHPHSKAHNGSIGPDPTGPGGIAHNGIQCAVEHNPNLPQSLPFVCPADSD
ncbi:MAG: hypothetical protein R3324_11755, partial [Halobacteriales archaeon]|nr:hypothetical protein [Halobacteriales archaeon]